MADWYGSARTNFVRVKDVDALINFIDGLPLTVEKHPSREGYVTFQTDSEYGGFDHIYLDDLGDDCEWSWSDVATHLAEGQVLVVQEVGAEKLRYLTGYALAITWDGRESAISLDSIYELAAKEFGIPANQIATCTYQDTV